MTWNCPVCGFSEKGARAPQQCPVCGTPGKRFVSGKSNDERNAAIPADQDKAAQSTTSRWKCSVCGYTRSGSRPEELCPVCGTPGERFTSLSDSSGAAGGQGKQLLPQKKTSRDSRQERKWRCSVCGYVHTGPEPPEECPVCGSDRSLFLEITEEKQPEMTDRPAGIYTAANEKESGQPPSSSIWMQRFELVREKMVELHAHPIFVHIPNGLLPIAVLFLLLAVVFSSETLSKASFYNLIVVALAMPAVLFSGYNDWQKRFGGRMTRVFMIKILCGGTISLGSLVLVAWRLLSPGVVSAGSNGRWGYLFIHILLLAAAMMAGFQGGKLIIFPDGSDKK